MRQRSRVAVALGAYLLAACGGKYLSASATDVGGADSGDGSGGSASPAGRDPGAGAGAVGGTPAGSGGVSCDYYEDDLGTNVSVEIINASSAPLYFGDKRPICGDAPLFMVKDQNGGDLSPVSACHTPCDVVGARGAELCPELCAPSAAVLLRPGGTISTNWTGLYSDVLELPRACVSASGASKCERASVIQPGVFTFSARAGTGVDCSQVGSGDVACESCPADFNPCRIEGALITGDLKKTSVRVMLDADYGIVPSTRPNRTPDAPGGRSVQLVFSD